MSIISSAKIEQKTRTLLTHLEKFSFADVRARPGVVVLHAKAPVASKMVSIVEIAKREIQKNKGKWWQYSRLHGQTEEVKAKKGKAEGKTIGEWEREKEKTAEAEKNLDQVEENAQDLQQAEYGDEEEAFEVLEFKGRNPTMPNLEHIEGRKKIRAVPIMTIYMSRVRIPEFKDLFGWVPPTRKFCWLTLTWNVK